MSGVPYGSEVSPRWSFEQLYQGGVPVPVLTPPAGVGVSTPTLSIGTTPELSVGTIKYTVDQLLGDNINAPITCQALLDSADAAVFASTNPNGYHTLPPSGKKIHEHLSSGNITELKTSGDIITTGGDVGVGTNAPDEKLHVVGNIKATGTGNITTTGSIESAKDANDVISYFGKAAIGDVAYDYFAGFAHHDRAGITTDYALLQSSSGQTFINAGEDGNPQPIFFRVNDDTKMYLKGDGNVGIGTTNPGQKLEVSGNIKATGTLEAHANSNDATAVSQIGFAKIGANTWDDTVSFSHKDKHNSSSFGLRLGNEGHTVLNSAAGKYTQLTIGNFQAIHIGQNKNVRIGSTVSEPSHKLHVDGDFKATGKIINGHKTTNSNDTMHFYTGTPSSGDVLRMALMGNTSVTSGNLAVGNLGINVTTYEEKLHVGGNIKADQGIIAASSTIGSDDRLKHNEEDITDSLDVIRKLKPQKYQKTKELKAADFNGPLEEDDVLCVEAGFIAQDIQNIPELAYSVTGGDYTGKVFNSEGVLTETAIERPYYLNYNNILTYNVAATQELDTTVTALLAEIASLKERLSALEN